MYTVSKETVAEGTSSGLFRKKSQRDFKVFSALLQSLHQEANLVKKGDGRMGWGLLINGSGAEELTAAW